MIKYNILLRNYNSFKNYNIYIYNFIVSDCCDLLGYKRLLLSRAAQTLETHQEMELASQHADQNITCFTNNCYNYNLHMLVSTGITACLKICNDYDVDGKCSDFNYA